MTSAQKRKTLIVSSLIIMLCMAILAGSTFALFTETAKLTNHLQAGDLKAILRRTSLEKTTLDGDGYLVELDPITTVVNFSEETTENVFGIGAEEKIVPGSKFSATMTLKNEGDVAFGYWVEIACPDAYKVDGQDLAKQLKVTVTTDRGVNDFVGNGLIIKGANGGDYVGDVTIGETETFTVTVEFLDSFIASNGLAHDDNDLAQGEKLSFDLIVHAVQATTAPTTP